MEKLLYRIIKSKTQYKSYCALLEELIFSGMKDRETKDKIALLELLIEKWEKENPNFTHQVFGFDISESNRAISMKLNNPHTKPIFPLQFHGLTKRKYCQKKIKTLRS